MLTGMLTVALVLTLVVACGNLLIWAVNKWGPTPPAKAEGNGRTANGTQGLAPKKLAAIVAAAESLTGGKVTAVQKKP